VTRCKVIRRNHTSSVVTSTHKRCYCISSIQQEGNDKRPLASGPHMNRMQQYGRQRHPSKTRRAGRSLCNKSGKVIPNSYCHLAGFQAISALVQEHPNLQRYYQLFGKQILSQSLQGTWLGDEGQYAPDIPQQAWCALLDEGQLAYEVATPFSSGLL
jgi:hypothetical protein